MTAMATIRTPVLGYTGEVVGVKFVDGVGESDEPSKLAYFRRHGYTVEAARPARKSK